MPDEGDIMASHAEVVADVEVGGAARELTGVAGADIRRRRRAVGGDCRVGSESA